MTLPHDLATEASSVKVGIGTPASRILPNAASLLAVRATLCGVLSHVAGLHVVGGRELPQLITTWFGRGR